MRYTRDHVPILKVIEAAGVDMYTPLHRALSSTGGSFLGMSSEEETKWMERRRKILKKLRGKKMSRRGGTQWIDVESATSSKRSSQASDASGSVGNQPASLCSWDPSTEQAINVGLMGDEDAIIEEEEEEEEEAVEAELKPEQEPRSDEELLEARSELAPSEVLSDTDSVYSPRPDEELLDTRSELAPSEILSDTKSEYTYSSEANSELESSTTDVDGTVDGHSTMEVSFDPIDALLNKIAAENRSISDRSSISSFGSGQDMVVDYHGVFFGGDDHMGLASTASISESSLGIELDGSN
jgi:hypothetical protein